MEGSEASFRMKERMIRDRRALVVGKLGVTTIYLLTSNTHVTEARGLILRLWMTREENSEHL